MDTSSTYLGHGWISRSLGQGQMYFCHILPNHLFYLFLFHSNTIKVQGHLKVKVTQYQGQMSKNQFYVLDCKCFCDLCVMRMVRLRVKGILVLNHGTILRVKISVTSHLHWTFTFRMKIRFQYLWTKIIPAVIFNTLVRGNKCHWMVVLFY